MLPGLQIRDIDVGGPIVVQITPFVQRRIDKTGPPKGTWAKTKTGKINEKTTITETMNIEILLEIFTIKL